MNADEPCDTSIGPMDPLPPQLCSCPVCNGTGLVPRHGTTLYNQCPYCLGARAVLVYPGGTVRPAKVTP